MFLLFHTGVPHSGQRREETSPPESGTGKRRDSCFTTITVLMIVFGLIPFLLLLLLNLLRAIF